MLVSLLRFFAAAILVTGCAFPKAEAAKLWRKVPVTEYEKIHRLHSPGISDIEVGIDGVIYAITNGGLQRWDNYRWFTVDRDPEPLRWNEKENRYYAKVRTSPIGERPQGDFVPMIEPDRMIGIAKRFAIDSAGQFWVTTSNGRVFKGVANDWKREDIMASEVIAGPKGQLVAWSINPAHRQRETEHKDWMKENPHPKWFNGTTWIDLDHIPVPFATMTFDSKGSLWLLASEGRNIAPDASFAELGTPGKKCLQYRMHATSKATNTAPFGLFPIPCRTTKLTDGLQPILAFINGETGNGMMTRLFPIFPPLLESPVTFTGHSFGFRGTSHLPIPIVGCRC